LVQQRQTTGQGTFPGLEAIKLKLGFSLDGPTTSAIMNPDVDELCLVTSSAHRAF
jgi:hypothetical protein